MNQEVSSQPKRFPPLIHYLFWLLPLTLLLGVFYLTILKDIPSPFKLGQYNIPQTTKIYDRNGKLLFDSYIEQNRTLVKLEQIPLTLQQATIATEDKDFYYHYGINPVGGVIRALSAIVFKQQLQGGSTITQQLIKTALLTPERTIQRKIKEFIMAPIVEILYSKNQILEMYLNQVPYGGTAWGVEAASETYFGKKVNELNLAESALLAGLPAAPTLYSPHGAHPEYAKERQSEVLQRMVEEKYITQQQKEEAQTIPLEFKPLSNNIKAPHFAMYVKQQLVDRYGQGIVEHGGLKVTTTLDLDIQEYAQDVIATEVANLQALRVGNGAALVTRPATGEILAMVGSRDYFATDSGNFNVTTATRQPGSSIKPINYAIGIETHKVNPATMFLDTPTCFGVAGQPAYCPVNYDGQFHGPVQLRFALGNSYNIPAVKMIYLNTVEAMVASSSAFGITTLKDPKNYGLSLTLGGGEVQMTDMATAFGVFANGGIRKDLVSILKVEDRNGAILDEYKDANLKSEIPSSLLIHGPRVISSETAFLLSHILLDNNARSGAFGPSSLLNIPGHAVSVKTGTTDDKRDNWTIGFTPQYVVAVWVGNNDNSPMHPYLSSGVTGAAPIWNKIMTKILTGKKDLWPKQPEGIIGAHICTPSGKLPPNPDGDDKGCETRYEYFIKETVPKETEVLKQGVMIDKGTGRLAPPNQTDNVEPQEKSILSDGMSRYCLDCPNDGQSPSYISPQFAKP